MRRLIPCAVAVALVALVSNGAAAQLTKTITGETTVSKATVESIERTTRTVTLKKDDGTYEVLSVPTNVVRFDSLRVGDTVTARYYTNIVFRLKPAGEKAIDTSSASSTPVGGAKPAGTVATQRAITATITALDPKVPSISFTGPNGWNYSSRIQDKKVLDQVKVGDRVDITWTEAAIVSFDDK